MVIQTMPAPSTATTGTARFTVLNMLSPDKRSAGPIAGPALTNSEFRIRNSEFLCGCGRFLGEHLAEHLDSLRHLLHGAEGDAGVGLLEGREVARDHHPPGAAGLAERFRGRADVHEHEV